MWIVSAILTWLTEPSGKLAVVAVFGISAFVGVLWQRPYLALGSMVLGLTLLFGAQIFVQTL